MKSAFIKRLFSSILLIIYCTMIFQHVFLDGLHFISHTSDLLSNQFKFHHHGNGKMHFHHSHDMVGLLQEVFNSDSNHESDQQEVLAQFQFKLHLHAPFDIVSNTTQNQDQKISLFADTYYETILDILTPPPKA